MIRVERSEGLTGIDTLDFEILPDQMRPSENHPIWFNLRIDRPGATEQELGFVAKSNVTWIDRGSESTWTRPGSMTLRLFGAFPEQIDQSGELSVTGARLERCVFGSVG